ncbi:hypothetical protein F5Y15DRAFT_212902 [Xylariaceae sp. FL0016]|nr:hypothetical protein F5Y15DRAFT_212902 [Xylariaceae sp. FL0016]
MGRDSDDRVAYVEDADDNGDRIPGTEPQYARSTAPSSPTKERPNTGRSRKGGRRRESISPVTQTESDSTESPDTTKRHSKMDKKKKRRDSNVVAKSRPQVHRSSKTTPAPSSRISDDSSAYYGIPPQTIPSSSRPRAQTRPESYYGQSMARPPQRPPMSSSAYWNHPPSASGLSPPSFVGGSWNVPHHHLAMPPHEQDYFAHPAPTLRNELVHRYKRPQSAMGFSPSSSPIDFEQPAANAITRRASVSRKPSKEHDDRRRMPPPARPQSTRPERVSVRDRQRTMPPPPTHRKSARFEDEDLEYGDSSSYHDVSRRASVEYGSAGLPARASHNYNYHDSIFGEGDLDLEPAAPPRNRRGSQARLEKTMRDASAYQSEVSSGQNAALTTDALKHFKNSTSSRSTRSSASRDESDYKHSVTTRTTRSSSGSDDITIKVPSGTTVEVGGAKIHCRDGGDISLGRGATSRGGSDRSTSYGDDRRSRAERSTTARTRSGSQAAYRALTAPPPRYAPPNTYHPDYATHYPLAPYPYSHHYERDTSEEFF